RINTNINVWTVYEHISGIIISVGDTVDPFNPIAQFMNRDELDKYGWQFDHVHFEILKQEPRPLKVNNKTPFRFYGSYNLECYSKSDLDKLYYDPIEFLKNNGSL
ncbi:hypothetical protein JYT36_00140, partial [Bacteroidales bacterium AH-315-N07]|nr:hypothetical protein [Bacteroidales bacterium AH-315-N07]